MTTLLHIADRVFNQPLLIHPDKAEVILYALRERLGGDIEVPQPDASRFVGSRRREDGSISLSRRHRGVALIPVLGSLVNRGAWLDASSGLTSYEGTIAQIRDAAADPSVATIVLDIDSPGGEAGGMVGIASAIRAAREQKRVVAVVDDMAASAAYGIASAADEIVVSETSVVGSIGVVLLHLDRSAELAAQGVKPTLIHAGAHKVDGNAYGPLPEAVRADMQARVNQIYESFLATVAAGRGEQRGRRGRTLRTLTADKARSTEARVFIGREAISIGLADRIGTLEGVLADYSSSSRATSRSTTKGNTTMSHPTDMISAEDHRAAVSAAVERTRSEAAAAQASAIATARAEGEAAAASRIFGIIELDVAQGRTDAAVAIAKTGATVDQARAVLAAVPAGAASPVASLAARLDDAPSATGATAGVQSPAAAEANAGKSAWDKAIARHNAFAAR